MSVHTRTTDYAVHLYKLYKLKPVNSTYIHKAVTWFKEKHHVRIVWDILLRTTALKYMFHLQMPLFVFLSDSITWVGENFSNSSGVCSQGECFSFGTGQVKKRGRWDDGNEDSGNDLATMAACNHTILTYGTFGMWGALLAGYNPGHDVLIPAGYKDTLEVERILKAHLVGWTVLHY